MNKRMYCLFDAKANIYMNPLVFINDGEAMRWFTTIVNSKEDSNVSLYPRDFTLIYLGTFDDESGKLSNEIEELCSGVTVKDTEQKYGLKELFSYIDKKLSETR